MPWLQTEPGWDGRHALRLWMRLWQGQPGVDERPDRDLWGQAAGFLASVRKKYQLNWESTSHLITWWWLWKVPAIQGKGSQEGAFPPTPRPLFGCVKEWKRWMQEHESAITQVGLVEACLLETSQEDETTWTRPPTWHV